MNLQTQSRPSRSRLLRSHKMNRVSGASPYVISVSTAPVTEACSTDPNVVINDGCRDGTTNMSNVVTCLTSTPIHNVSDARKRSVPKHVARYGSGESALAGQRVVLPSSGAGNVKSQSKQISSFPVERQAVPDVGQIHLLRYHQRVSISSSRGALLLLVVVPAISRTLAHYSQC